ncbi:MAG: alpha/beta fold hydrolase [Actinomycetota bacterium]|nr:alpha/beta fold hydrolase [Actinomycetota bacterium]
MSEFPTKRGQLWVRTFGDPPAPLVALHGFTLHGGMFQTLADELGATVVAPDLPGHGRTAIEPITMESAVASVAELLADLAAPPLLLGYSQGGRVALQIALAHPELVESLVLISTGPGMPSSVRKVRRVADDALATRIERIGLERFIDEWLANPVTTTDGVSPDLRRADREIRFENTATGLAEALRGMGQASVPDSIRRISSLPMPVVLMAGERDAKYSEMAYEMAATRDEYPVIVRGAGHNVLLAAPTAVATAVGNLLSP